MNLYNELHNEKYYNRVILKSLNKDKKVSVLEYEDIPNGILNHQWSSPNKVQIPKSNGNGLRDIYVFNELDSTYHKIISEVLNSNYNISDYVFSYKENASTFNAGTEIQKYLNGDYTFIKLDISNYFLSVNQEVIYSYIDKICDDIEGRQILKSLYNTKDKEGNYLSLMPGCAVSGFFANVVLSDFDETINPIVDKYIRYSDDILIITKDSASVNVLLEYVLHELRKYGLTINPNKIEISNLTKNIEFLGLDIAKDYIEVSNNTYKNLKSKIKHICKVNKSLYLRIYNLNKYLYGLKSKGFKTGSIMTYLFNNITKVDTIIELDFYIKDTLRASVTGKHNKANAIKVPNEELYKEGYINIIDMYNTYKTNKRLYCTVSNTMLNFKDRPGKLIEFNYDIVGTVHEITYDFIDLLKEVLTKSQYKLILDSKIIELSKLDINIYNKEISYNNQLIYRDNKLLINSLDLFNKSTGELYKVTLTYNAETKYNKDEIDFLLTHASYSTSSKYFVNRKYVITSNDDYFIFNNKGFNLELVNSLEDFRRVGLLLLSLFRFDGHSLIGNHKIYSYKSLYIIY